MTKETQMEVIKALAYGMPIMDIANMADMEEEEVKQFAKEHVEEIKERKRMAEEFGL